MKRFIALLLCLCLTVCAAAGCRKRERKEYSHTEVLNDIDDYPIIKDEYKDSVVLKIMGSSSATISSDWANNKFFKRMYDLTGVKFNFDNVFLENMYKQKKGLVFTSDDSMPDIFFKAFFNNYDEVTYGTSGQLLSLNKLIKDYAPHIQQLLDDYPIIKRCITTTDGNIYALPTIYTNTPSSSIMRGFWWIDKEWLTEVGEINPDGSPKLPETIEDLYRVLTKFKNKCAASGSAFAYPLVICGMSELMNLFPIFGLDVSQYFVQAGANGNLQFTPQTENFKVALSWFRKFFEEGLINPDWNTFTETKKYTYGRTGNIYGMYQSASPAYVSGTDKVERFITVNPMTSEINDEKFWSATYPLERGCFAISSTCQYPELAMRWIDTLYDTSSDYWIWAIDGKEKVEWQWTDPEKTQWKSLISDSEYAERMKNTIVQPGDGMPYAVDEKFFDKETTNSSSYVRPQRNRQMAYGKVSYPMVYFGKSDLKTLSGLSSDIDTYVKRFVASSVNEGMTEQGWREFSAFNDMGLSEYLSILQKAYDNFYGIKR